MTEIRPENMSVLHLVPSRGSPFFENQIKILEELGVTCDVLDVTRDFATEATIDKTAGVSAGLTLKDYFKFIPTVLKTARNSYDLIHANYGYTAPFAVMVPGIPSVVSLWGGEARGEYGPLVQFSTRFSDANIVMSEWMTADVRGKAYVIPHGVDLNTFRPIPENVAKSKLGWETNEHHVLFPYAPSRPEKNYELAEKVVIEAEEKIGEAINIHVVYNEPHDMIPVFMNAADVLLLTSEYEGSPNSVKEALACNLPVVSTDVGDVSKWINNLSYSTIGESKEELANGVISAIRDESQANSIDIVDEISLTTMGNHLVEVYRDILIDDES